MNSEATGKYRADVDGLRAIAVLAVVLYHAKAVGFSGGFVGVDVFFVISGYLITAQILKESELGTFSLLAFYSRRIRRLLPAATAVLIVSTVVAVLLLTPAALVAYGRSLAASSAYLANVHFWRSSGYFEAPAEFSPLLHTWSLAVEEQFYLAVPVLIWGLVRFARKLLVPTLIAVSAVSLAFAIWSTSAIPTSAFFLLPSRFWEMLLGGILVTARIPEVRRRSMANAIALGGLAGIVLPVFAYGELTRFPGLNALPPCLGTALLLHAHRSAPSPVRTLFELTPIVALGRVSYSLYLWHWPVLVFARHWLLRPLTSLEGLRLVGASVLFATLSYRYVEQPFRRAKSWKPRWVLAVGLAIAALGVATGTGLAQSGGLPQRFDFVVAEPRAAQQGNCTIPRDSGSEAWSRSECELTAGGPVVLLWGDSLAGQYASGLRERANEVSATYLLYSQSECLPAIGYSYPTRPMCKDVNMNVLSLIEEQGVDVVVMAGRWELAYKRRDWAAFELIRDTISTLQAKGVEVHVVLQSPIFAMAPYDLLLRSGAAATETARAFTDSHVDVNRKLSEVTGSATVIDVASEWCDGSECIYFENGNLVFSDLVHLSPYGSAETIDLLPFVAEG